MTYRAIHRLCIAACFIFMSAGLLKAAVQFPLEGTIAEVINGGSYTYVQVNLAEGSCWVATVPGPYRAGTTVRVAEGITMNDFTSAELARTFDEIIFTDNIDAIGMSAAVMQSGRDLPPGHPPVGGSKVSDKAECPVSHAEDAPESGISGEIIETMNAGGYTYIQVRGEEKTIWAATGEFDAKVGQQVVVPDGMVMRNFTSQTLDKTFTEIYFVDRVYTGSGDAASGDEKKACCEEHAKNNKPKMPEHSAKAATATTLASELIDPPEGGYSIADIYNRRQELAGQVVLVRGRVVKLSRNILGKNWLHLDDGSIGTGGQDLAVTTAENEIREGDLVTLKGTVAVDVSLGSNYDYPLLLEDAEIE